MTCHVHLSQKSWHTYECDVIVHIWISHDLRMNVSCASFTCATWFIHSYMSFTCATWFIYMWHMHTYVMTYSYVHNDVCELCVKWLYICDIYVERFICDYVPNEAFIRDTCFIHTCATIHSLCDMTHSYVRRDPFICVPWLIHMRDVTDSYM